MTLDPSPQPAAPARRSRRVLHLCLATPAVLLGAYLVSAYVFIPLAWSGYARRHPALGDAPRLTHTANGIPGDPLNVALIGNPDAVAKALLAAGWRPADPITFKTTVRLTGASLLHRPYEQAPVSNLYLWDRKQDLAYQKPVGNSPSQRHHVRFWSAPEVDDAGRPLWFAAATYDTSVGFSRTTWQVTHHIAADVDAERDLLLQDLREAGQLEELTWVVDFHEQRQGKNGGGDPYHTDGRLPVGVLVGLAE
jgi:hypothetical protein